MKKLIYILVFIIVAVVIMRSFRGDNDIKNYPSRGANIVAFGGSITVGVGSTKGNDFVSLLSDKLGEPIKNLGVSGDTTQKGLARIDEVLESDPKMVLVSLGGNDYLRRVSKEDMFSNLSNIIELIQEQGAVVVILGMRGGVLRDNYKDDFKNLSIKYSTAYVPNILDGLLGHKNFMYDAIHPNDSGHAMIADKIYPIIKDLI